MVAMTAADQVTICHRSRDPRAILVTHIHQDQVNRLVVHLRIGPRLRGILHRPRRALRLAHMRKW